MCPQEEASAPTLSTECQEQLAIEWGKFTPGEYQQSALEKVFVGGDVANRTADAISAIEDGHHAARGIDRFLDPDKFTATQPDNGSDVT